MITVSFFDQRGFSLVEVMVSMVILAFSILGVTAMFQSANEGLQDGAKGLEALTLAEARVEVKRTAPWSALLMDDLDADGIAELQMQDDGLEGDARAGDGIYSGLSEKDGIHLVWTIQPDRPGPIESSRMVTIKAQALYQVGVEARSVETGTLRVNPAYVGSH